MHAQRHGFHWRHPPKKGLSRKVLSYYFLGLAEPTSIKCEGGSIDPNRGGEKREENK